MERRTYRWWLFLEDCHYGCQDGAGEIGPDGNVFDGSLDFVHDDDAPWRFIGIGKYFLDVIDFGL